VELVKLAGEAPSRLRELRLPILVVQGTADRLVPQRAGRLVVDWVASPDKTLRMYDGLYHEVFNEPERELVLDEVVEWLDRHAD
jgi:acylglycerol lipase